VTTQEWILVGLTIVAIIGIASFFLLMRIRKYQRYESARAAMERAQAAHGEAISAHDRIDRIDDNLQDDRRDALEQRSTMQKIEGWVKFVMHRDISDEIKRESEREKEANKP